MVVVIIMRLFSADDQRFEAYSPGARKSDETGNTTKLGEWFALGSSPDL
jgi:hypothetical protein